MVQMTARLRAGAVDRLVRELKRDTTRLAAAERTARARAAEVATRTTHASFHYRRPVAPPRIGRQNTAGKFVQYLNWKPSTLANANLVEFDLATANQRVPYWIIQELGTGPEASAVIKRAGVANPRGRPTAGANHVVSIPSQVGRWISPNLGWADAPGAAYSPPSKSRRDQQLYLRRTLRGRGVRTRGQGHDMFIGREIEGQHMVRRGGQEGFRQYQTQVLAAARRAFERKS